MPVLLQALQLNRSPSMDVFVCPLHTLQVSSGAPHFLHFITSSLIDTQDPMLRSTAIRRAGMIVALSSEWSNSGDCADEVAQPRELLRTGEPPLDRYHSEWVGPHVGDSSVRAGA